MLASVVLLSSCYNTRLLVGNVKAEEAVVEVAKVTNHHLIAGLIPLSNTDVNVSKYVPNAEDYVVKTNLSFINYLLAAITGGIYTPSQTTIYVPLKDAGNR